MPALAAVRHLTRYLYRRPATLGPQVVRLTPAPSGRVASHSLTVLPARHVARHERDRHGNRLVRLAFDGPVTELRIEARLVADVTAPPPGGPMGAEARPDPRPLTSPEEPGPWLRALLDAVPRAGRSALDLAADVNARVARAVGYVPRPEPGVQAAEHTLRRGTGSCRDSSWLLVQALRHLGLPARFVSGYLIRLDPVEGPRGSAGDAVDLHAWAEAFVPGAGWVGLDPTSGGPAGPGHVALAAAPHHADAAPLTGLASHADVDLLVRMEVERGAGSLDVAPRPGPEGLELRPP